jgi:hypothetical protein
MARQQRQRQILSVINEAWIQLNLKPKKMYFAVNQDLIILVTCCDLCNYRILPSAYRPATPVPSG